MRAPLMMVRGPTVLLNPESTSSRTIAERIQYHPAALLYTRTSNWLHSKEIRNICKWRRAEIVTIWSHEASSYYACEISLQNFWCLGLSDVWGSYVRPGIRPTASRWVGDQPCEPFSRTRCGLLGPPRVLGKTCNEPSCPPRPPSEEKGMRLGYFKILKQRPIHNHFNCSEYIRSTYVLSDCLAFKDNV